ncbi:hypothetical protein [Chelativorans sp. J32]|uniref:hypothetical protein n=1 Tax=Chelativorans sp. J32 TaxID=935840 RepID=UPI000481ADDE|nr:hypothetical protein [Chelativorans sp. J32]
MALDRDPNYVFRDFVTDGIPASGKWDPRKPEIRQLLSEWWQVLIALIAGAGGDIDLPNLLIRYTVTGGTPNAITATPNLPVPSGPGLALFSIQIQQTNTGPVTINGKPLLTSSGNQLTAGGLVAGGMYLFLDNGSSFRLLTDQASAALVAQMETLLNDMKRRYLGSFADNAAATAAAGGTPSSGQLYWNTTSSEMRIWNGSAWQAFAAVVADRAITLPKLGDISFSSFRQWGFETSVEGWTALNGTLSAQNGVLTFVSTAADPQLSSPIIAIPGALFSKIRMRVRRISGNGTWDGSIYYTTTNHGISGSYLKRIAAPSNFNEWQVLEWDMADLTQGGNDWITSTITRLRIDLSQSSGDTLEIDWISIGDRALALPKAAGPLHLSVIGDTQAALDTAHALADDIIIDRPVAITSTATWPNGKRYFFVNGGQLDVANGVTLTIRGQVIAGIWRKLAKANPEPNKIFNCTGTGAVVGIRKVHPEWWGAVKDGTTPVHAQFQAAQNCIEASAQSDGDEAVVILGGGSYAFAAQVVVTPRQDICLKWRGQGGSGGTFIVALASWSGPNGVIKFAAAPSNQTYSEWHFCGFRVIPETAGTGSAVGIIIGAGATTLHGGVQESALFEDINVYQFNECWYVQNARLVQWSRCGGWSETLAGASAFRVVAANGEFTGDFDTYSCQFVSKGTNGRTIFMSASGSTATLSGIRHHAAIMYQGGVVISASAGARVCDIWFDSGWQLDVFLTEGFILLSDGTGSHLYNVNISNGYVASGIIGTVKAVNIATSNSGIVRGVFIRGNYFINNVGDVIYANGNVVGYIVTDNFFTDCNGGNMVTVGSGVQNAIVTGNTAQRMSTSNSIAALAATISGANFYAIRNNMAGGIATQVVNDAAAAAQKIVDGNF